MLKSIAKVAHVVGAKPRGTILLFVPLICLGSLLGGCAASDKPGPAATGPAAGAEFNMDTTPSSATDMEKQLNQIQKDSVSAK